MGGLVTVRDGRPTELQAKPLVERFQQMHEGDVIQWGEIEGLIGERLRTNRFSTVCNAARRTLHKETGVVLKAVPGIGLRMPTGDEQVRHGVDWMRSGARKIRRGAAVVTGIADVRLTEQGKAERTHVVAALVTIQRAVDAEQKKLRVTFSPTKAMPLIDGKVE